MSSDEPEKMSIPPEVIIAAMRESDGELCWRYMGLGRGWHARFNPETKSYEVAVSANVPERTGDGSVTVKVETKQHWEFGSMDIEEWLPARFSDQRLEPVNIEKTPFPDLGEPEHRPNEVVRRE